MEVGYWDIFVNGYRNFAAHLWKEITFQYDDWWHNYTWMLIVISAFFFVLELITPWRKDQAKFRKDFWLDFFYMFFNFSLFWLVVYAAVSDVGVELFRNFLGLFGVENLVANWVIDLPLVAHLLIGFVVRDFVQWWIHRLLHRVPFLWEFHKVHHSVEQMGFAAHLRFHWMETVVYRVLEYLPLAMLGIGLHDFFLIHMFSLVIGHMNHSNLNVSYGPLKYLFNNPRMHIWHHAHEVPASHPNGVNFALTLSVWDYLFGTNYIPHEGRDIRLGFGGIERFPKTFLGQVMYGFLPRRKNQKEDER